MTREMAPRGVPTPAMADYYARRAQGGVGLIITEGISPAQEGSFGTSVPRLDSDEAIDGWSGVVAAVHAHEARIFAQLWHVGAFTPSLIGMSDSMSDEQVRLSPSGLAAADTPFGQAMTTADAEQTIDRFVAAAISAQRSGFDGIELHGAHGYLLDQFFWPTTNIRRDRLGGSPSGRVQFAVDLVRRIKAATASSFPVALRLSQWKQLDYHARIADNAADLEAIVGPLADAGVDLFHLSTRRFWEAEFPGDPRNLAAWVKALTGKPVITVGSVTLDVDFKAKGGKTFARPALEHVRLLEAGIDKGWFDLVAIGRALIANPDWVRLVEAGRADRLRPFDRHMLEQLV